MRTRARSVTSLGLLACLWVYWAGWNDAIRGGWGALRNRNVCWIQADISKKTLQEIRCWVSRGRVSSCVVSSSCRRWLCPVKSYGFFQNFHRWLSCRSKGVHAGSHVSRTILHPYVTTSSRVQLMLVGSWSSFYSWYYCCTVQSAYSTNGVPYTGLHGCVPQFSIPNCHQLHAAPLHCMAQSDSSSKKFKE